MKKLRALIMTSPIDETESSRLLGRLDKGFQGVKFVLVARLAARGRSFLLGAAKDPILTPRQTEVLREMAMGRGMKEIGRKLGISPKTVETHRLNLMNRLHIRHVPGLVRYGLRAGLIPATWLMRGV